MAPVRPAAAAPTIAPAVFLRSDLRVSVLFSLEDSSASCLDETDCLRTFGMRHLNGLLFCCRTPTCDNPTQVFSHAANHTPTSFFPQSCLQWARLASEKTSSRVEISPSRKLCPSNGPSGHAIQS